MIEDLQEEANCVGKSKRRVTLQFNQNDEMVEKLSDGEVDQSVSMLDSIDQIKQKNKLQAKNSKKVVSEVTVNLGDEEYNFGKNKITPDIFDGQNKKENAQVFFDNYEKTKERYQY